MSKTLDASQALHILFVEQKEIFDGVTSYRIVAGELCWYDLDSGWYKPDNGDMTLEQFASTKWTTR